MSHTLNSFPVVSTLCVGPWETTMVHHFKCRCNNALWDGISFFPMLKEVRQASPLYQQCGGPEAQRTVTELNKCATNIHNTTKYSVFVFSVSKGAVLICLFAVC